MFVDGEVGILEEDKRKKKKKKTKKSIYVTKKTKKTLKRQDGGEQPLHTHSLPLSLSLSPISTIRVPFVRASSRLLLCCRHG